MKINTIGFSLFFLAVMFLSSCQPSPRIEVIGPPTHGDKISPPATEALESRISHLQNLLADNPEPDDRRVIEEFIESYSTLRELSLSTDPDSNRTSLIRAVFQRVVSIEEQFFQGRRVKRETPSPDIDRYWKENAALLERYLAHDYQAVITQCLALEDSFGSEALTPEAGLLFALSLAETDMIGEAVKTGEKVMKRLEGRPDLLLLRTKLIAWYLAEGKKDKAAALYRELSDDLDERKALFKSLGRELDRAPAPEAGGRMDEQTGDAQTATPLPDVIKEADRLVQQRAYTEAKLLLIKARIQTDNEADIQIIDQALKNIDLSQKRIEQGQAPPADELSENEALKTAATLIEEEKYEEALGTLENIERQRVPGPEAVRLKGVAVEKIINRDRNRAARLFLEAKQVGDPARKKALLRSSLDILKKLVDKYPSSYLIERINEHISIVEKALGDL